MESGIAKWLYRHISQDVCPWNVKFSRDAMESAFTPREVIAGKDAQSLATAPPSKSLQFLDGHLRAKRSVRSVSHAAASTTFQVSALESQKA